MASMNYQYTTSPRKLEPDYNKRKKRKPKKQKLKVVQEIKRQDIKVSKEKRIQQFKIVMLIAIAFIIVLVISYRNSQINESFSEVQNLKKELSSLQKENEQTKVNIENSLNLNYIEQI